MNKYTADYAAFFTMCPNSNYLKNGNIRCLRAHDLRDEQKMQIEVASNDNIEKTFVNKQINQPTNS